MSERQEEQRNRERERGQERKEETKLEKDWEGGSASLIYALSAHCSVHHSTDETFNTIISVRLPPTFGEKSSPSLDNFCPSSCSSSCRHFPGFFPFNLRPFIQSSWHSVSGYLSSFLGSAVHPVSIYQKDNSALIYAICDDVIYNKMFHLFHLFSSNFFWFWFIPAIHPLTDLWFIFWIHILKICSSFISVYLKGSRQVKEPPPHPSQ